MSVQQKTPRRVTVTPADPKYLEKDIRKQHLRVAPYRSEERRVGKECS